MGKIIFLICAAAIAYSLWIKLDDIGMIPHTRECMLSVGKNWLIGESKDCASEPGSQNSGEATVQVMCGRGDDSSPHRLNVEFWGRPFQPENKLALWKCSRKNEGEFTCLQTGAMR
jgi:hypothetical protein